MTNSKSPVYTAMRHMPEGETSERIKMAGSLGILITSFKGDSVTRSSTICAYSAGSFGNYPSILKSFHIKPSGAEAKVGIDDLIHHPLYHANVRHRMPTEAHSFCISCAALSPKILQG